MLLFRLAQMSSLMLIPFKGYGIELNKNGVAHLRDDRLMHIIIICNLSGRIYS